MLFVGALIMDVRGQYRADRSGETQQQTTGEIERFNPWLIKPPLKQPRPSLPYESHGACPFECCTYREWSVDRDTDVFGDYRAKTPAKFHLKRGQKVAALTGVVVTTRLGVGLREQKCVRLMRL